MRRICLRVRTWLNRIFAERAKTVFDDLEFSDVRLGAIGFRPFFYKVGKRARNHGRVDGCKQGIWLLPAARQGHAGK